MINICRSSHSLPGTGVQRTFFSGKGGMRADGFCPGKTRTRDLAQSCPERTSLSHPWNSRTRRNSRREMWVLKWNKCSEVQKKHNSRAKSQAEAPGPMELRGREGQGPSGSGTEETRPTILCSHCPNSRLQKFWASLIMDNPTKKWSSSGNQTEDLLHRPAWRAQQTAMRRHRMRCSVHPLVYTEL